MENTPKLSDRFEMPINETETRTVFMSFALINTLAGYFESPNDVVQIYQNPMVQQSILVDCLSERDDLGKITKPFTLETMTTSYEDVIKFLSWVEEHLSNFFLRTLQAANHMMKRTIKTS